MMECTDWKTWLSQQDKGDCYFLVNSLANPNPVQLFYVNDWIEEAFPLYSGTPMNDLLAQSPWLIKPKAKYLPELALLLDKHELSDASWGWGYRSTLPWSFQLEHWRLHQQVLLRGRVVVLRLMDNRIFAPLLPALQPGDWRELLTPVNELMIDTPDPCCYYRPENCPQVLNENLFVLGDHLIEARYSTDTTLNNLAYALSCQLWENNAELAFKLDEPEGQLQSSLVAWLKQARDAKHNLNKLTVEHFITDNQQIAFNKEI
ncbi:DUF4123 domain-containing protein [Xenorhabdus sp. DI]|uniref:DUF4123 domain-containing protein n=1 Tax=Xenorhabdus doucetiae TaxID=351671 RepID=UPI0019879A72|nr:MULTISPECIES: DUF4123 domain-containing protein [unclassified Xenorhabdus]MBD2783922.1 DUF4123 domain-containing protein [Xenorhabdus sp. 3]MBD2788522.1 DUF4123 domain-containing protein [Xenorhabdus sp. DI]